MTFFAPCSIKMSTFLQITGLILDLLYFLKQGCNKERLKKKLLFIESNSPAKFYITSQRWPNLEDVCCSFTTVTDVNNKLFDWKGETQTPWKGVVWRPSCFSTLELKKMAKNSCNCHEILGNTCLALRYSEWLIKQWLLLNYAFMWYELFTPHNSSYQTWRHPIIFKYFPSTEGHLCTLSNTY